MCHDSRPNCASTKGQQVWSQTTSWASTWIQGSTAALSIISASTTEGKTDFPYGTTTNTIECIGVTVVKFSWTSTTSGTQAGAEAYRMWPHTAGCGRTTRAHR